MGILRQETANKTEIAPMRVRYLTHTDKLMMVVIDFFDGPGEEPDPPHSHPHEQVTYVADGKIVFYLNGEPFELSQGDMFTVPPDVPHSIQLLSTHARLVDTFTPLREEFLG